MLNNILKATQLISCGAKIPTLCDFKVHILSITLCWQEISGAWFKHNGLWLWAKRAIVMVPDPRETWSGRKKFLSQKDYYLMKKIRFQAHRAYALPEGFTQATLHSAQACHLSLTLSSQREREGVWTSSPGNAWGWESWVILGLFTFGIFLIFGPRKTPTCWKLFRVIHCWGFSSSPSAFSSSWMEKKNLLVISHNLWGSAFDSPTEKRETKRLREGPMGRCCWEGNMVHSIDLPGWGMVHLPLSAKGQSLPRPWLFHSKPSSQFHWGAQARACIRRRHRGSGPWEEAWKKREEEQVPGTNDACPLGSLATFSTDYPEHPISGWKYKLTILNLFGQPYDLWQALLHLRAPGNPRVWGGLLLFCKKAKGRVGLSTVRRGQDKGRLFELKT